MAARKRPAEAETGPEVMDAMQETPTLDRFFDRNPRTLTREDFLNKIKAERKLRALYIAKEQK